jgi:putative DNA primase/helicase
MKVSVANLSLVTSDEATTTDNAPPFSDEAIALDFAEANQDILRYVAKRGHWMTYDGKRWEPDETLDVFSLVRANCRKHANIAPKRQRRKIASASTVVAVERLARADDRFRATADQWDADPWLLNTSGGVIDLRLGTNFGHSPEHFVTRMTAVAAPMLNVECPLWHRFLDRITAGDRDLQGFLARMFGYALTGSTREHALFFLYGTGANGKSVLIETIRGVVGDYAKVAPIEAFTAGSFDRHPTEIAGLQGARLVTAVETNEGRAWDEAKIKALTGGDRVTARFMRQDFFEYTPQFKLVIAGNHKPALRNVDEATRRRFYLVPFTVTIPPSERDPDLAERLKAEWPGILRWMIDGCREWQTTGLQPPKSVLEATEAYLESEDAMGTWMGERCIQEPERSEKSSALFASWTEWCDKAGEVPGPQRKFSHALEARGFRKDHTRTGWRFYGLSLVPEMTTYD